MSFSSRSFVFTLRFSTIALQIKPLLSLRASSLMFSTSEATFEPRFLQVSSMKSFVHLKVCY